MSTAPERHAMRLEILRYLNPHIDEAERKCLWLFCDYQDIWLSPQELREENAKGSYIWGPVNWKLRDPQERLSQFDRDIRRLFVEKEKFVARINRWHRDADPS